VQVIISDVDIPAPQGRSVFDGEFRTALHVVSTRSHYHSADERI
jgi:hypothetical protein